MGSFGIGFRPTATDILAPAPLALTLLVVMILSAAVPSPAQAHDPSRTIRAEVPAAGLRAVDFNFGAGALRIRGTDGSMVRLVVEARCDDESSDRCADVLDHIRVRSSVSGERLDLELRGLSNRHLCDLDLEATLEIPRGLDFDLDMGAGELEIDGLESEVDVDLGAGEAVVRIPERAVRSVEMAVGIGEAALVRNGKRQEFVRIFSSPVRWEEGTGSSRVDISLGLGEAEVTLR